MDVALSGARLSSIRPYSPPKSTPGRWSPRSPSGKPLQRSRIADGSWLNFMSKPPLLRKTKRESSRCLISGKEAAAQSTAGPPSSFDEALIRRDEPSERGGLVLLNEMWAAGSLIAPRLPCADQAPRRLALRFSQQRRLDMKFNQGSVCNPGALEWQCLMGGETNGRVELGGEYGLMLDNRAPARRHPSYQGRAAHITEITRMRTLANWPRRPQNRHQ